MNKLKQLGMGLVGPGFVAPHHIDAVRRLGYVNIVGIAGSSLASATTKAGSMGISRSYASYEELVRDPEIDVVHNTTPNYLHFPVSMAAIAAGKHVISDKPLALTATQCRTLQDAAKAAGVVNAVTFNYRGNPLVQQARVMNAKRELGPTIFVHGKYLQDWMTDDHVYSWRMDTEKGGNSSALADIGSHWCDLAEHITGSKIVAVLADITTVVKTRYSSGSSGEAFQKDNTGSKFQHEIHGEDLASVLLRFENGARGCFSVGQVLPGHKNELDIEINGRTGSLRWCQEQQNELWIGRHNQPNCIMAKDPSLMSPEAGRYAHLPGGHQEAWSDAFFNVIADIYGWIRADANPSCRPSTLCDFADATHLCMLIEAMLRSNAMGGVWQKVAPEIQNKERPSGTVQIT